jgi:hypothetical protein
MRIVTQLVLSGALFLSASLPALAGVTVNFVEPDTYTDLKQQEFRVTAEDRDRILNDLRTHLEGLGAELEPHQSVTVDVLDIDLAGQTETTSNRTEDQRVAREHTAPSIKLRYVFEEGGQVIASAEETVTDQNYLNHPALRDDGDSLRYEKYMLDNWFRQRFIKRGATTP